jgi:hypothetical protein
MAWCVIKKKQGLRSPLGQAFKNVDSGIDLREEFFSAKIPITVLASFEDNLSLPEDKSQ